MTPSFYYMCLSVIVLCKCSTLVASDVYYHIKPSINASCPGEPCLTLSQFASQSEIYLESNTTLLFLPGQHNLSSELSVTAISHLSMTSMPALSNSPSAIIACEGRASLTFSSIDKVYIGHLTFSGCYGHKSISVPLFAIVNTSFLNHRGSALEFTSSTVKIVGSSFIANSPGSYQQGPTKFSIDDILWEGDDIYAYGGAAIALTQSSVVISGCVFKENHAEFGGAIFVKLQSHITIINTIFNQNCANCRYQEFVSEYDRCVGAALYSADGTVEVYNSTFYNNTIMNEKDVLVYQYGGVFALFDSTLKAEHCIFEQNRAEGYSRNSYGGVIHANNATVNISDSEFTSNLIGKHGGVMSMSNVVCFINNSRFVNNSVLKDSIFCNFGGGVLYIRNVSVTIINSLFEQNIAYHFCRGGVMMAEMVNFISIINSNFSNNSAHSGGVLHLNTIIDGTQRVIMSTMKIIKCEFSQNSAESTGGVIEVLAYYLRPWHITIIGTKFVRNKVSLKGGAFHLKSVIIRIHESEFVENSAQDYGGIVFATETNITIDRGMIERNSANTGVIYAFRDCSINLYNMTIKNNTANRGTICLFNGIGVLLNITLADNAGSVLVYFSNLTAINTVITNCSTSLNTKKTLTLGNTDSQEAATYQEGGALTMIQGSIAFNGNCFLIRNHAKLGGAIHATESKINVYGTITIAHNRALESGGGVYMYRSELNNHNGIEIVNNTCGSNGGGIHAIGSTILLWKSRTMFNFKENNAKQGGGAICFELNSKLYIVTTIYYVTKIIFENNTAKYGGAVFITDETNSGICASESYEIQSITTECFIQPFSRQPRVIFKNSTLVKFINNAASTSGSNLFGGLLDRCTISPFAEKKIVRNIVQSGGVTFFNSISNNSNFDSISSNPVRVCFCNKSRQPDCSYHLPPIQIEKGKLFMVLLVAVDQVNHTIPNVTIRSSLSSLSGGLGENHLSQSTGESCTDLEFQVFSPHNTEQLILYADGPCKDAPLSQRRVEVKFTPCTCPLGFQTNVGKGTKCDCECNSDLLPYVTKCDPNTETIVRETNFWIDYIGGYLVYPHCPLDYCKPSEDKVKINLNVENGADIQCANYRTGLLCGTCLSGYSLSLGSSSCIPCPSYWPAVTVTLILASVVAGVLFVTLLLLLNLTTAVGTLNGIIFYANVVAANSNAVFPSNVFISWLNLEVGFDICFFKGMDVYWKTWLQLAFPAYLIFLVVTVIYVCERSQRFTRLIGTKDPVATLATLVLLSYAKLLHTIIASLSGTVLKFPGLNHTREEVVWLPDASIKYLSGKHIPLFIVAVIILLAGVLYTTILFLGQWIIGLKLFRWLSNTHKLSLFIQTYHVPYAPKHRYWMGLLLVVRIVLYIVSSANINGDPKINLTAIGMVIVSTIILKDFVEYRGRVYHRQSTELLETACHFNLALLCVATFLTLDHAKASAIICHISVSFTAALLMAVLLYHLFTEVIFKSKVWKNYKERQNRSIIICDAPAKEQNIQTPTYSILEGPKRLSQLNSRKKKVGNMSKFGGELKLILLDQNDEYS